MSAERMLVKAKNWIADTFREDSRPDMQTVRRWVSEGSLDGCILGSTLYIEVADGLAHAKPKAKEKWFHIKES